ncbi:hypothetical protein BJX70DRAFT_214562 [Aspergillus crustosus]
MLFQISQCLFALALLGYGITPTLAQMPSYERWSCMLEQTSPQNRKWLPRRNALGLSSPTQGNHRLPLGSLKVPSGWTCDLHASDCWTQSSTAV